MTRIGLSCLCIGALLPPVSLHADPTPTASPTLEEFKADFEKQDAELNQVYTETMARLPPEQQKELKKSEVEWSNIGTKRAQPRDSIRPLHPFKPRNQQKTLRRTSRWKMGLNRRPVTP